MSVPKVKPNPNTGWADNPQAVEIDALIERARHLTADEAEDLKAAYNATDDDYYAAWFTALNSAWNSVRDTDRVTAWNIILTAAINTNELVGDAAVALASRDLVDGNTPWNQNAYDILTAQWRKVIGPVYPDDVVR